MHASLRMRVVVRVFPRASIYLCLYISVCGGVGVCMSEYNVRAYTRAYFRVCVCVYVCRCVYVCAMCACLLLMCKYIGNRFVSKQCSLYDGRCLRYK